MKLRAPAYPLITIDPYFSVWSMADKLTDKPPTQWTDRSSPIARTEHLLERKRQIQEEEVVWGLTTI